MTEKNLHKQDSFVGRIVEMGFLRGSKAETAARIFVAYGNKPRSEGTTRVTFTYQDSGGNYDIVVDFFHTVLRTPLVSLASKSDGKADRVASYFEGAFEALSVQQSSQKNAELLAKPGLLERAGMRLRQIRE